MEVRTNPAKFADVRLCLQTGEMRLQNTIARIFSAVFPNRELFM